MKKFILLGLFFTSLSIANPITIAVAANVSYAIDDLKKAFNKQYPQTKVRVVLGSSGKLTAQIIQNAPYHLFMSANMKYPESLYKQQIAITKPTVYAKGSLAYFSTKPLDSSKGMAFVLSDSVKKIAVGNPKTAPYGIATKEALKSAKLYDAIESKLIFAESISQTVSYTVRATNLGFVAKSALFSPKMKKYKKGINWNEVDPKLYSPIKQGIVILKKAKGNSEVQAFYDFMLSSKAKEILKNFGYIVE
jgi:molybdate transport system substrate-binding protein